MPDYNAARINASEWLFQEREEVTLACLHGDELSASQLRLAVGMLSEVLLKLGEQGRFRPLNRLVEGRNPKFDVSRELRLLEDVVATINDALTLVHAVETWDRLASEIREELFAYKYDLTPAMGAGSYAGEDQGRIATAIASRMSEVEKKWNDRLRRLSFRVDALAIEKLGRDGDAPSVSYLPPPLPEPNGPCEAGLFRWDGRLIELTAAQYAIMDALWQSRNKTVHVDDLYDAEITTPAGLDGAISRLNGRLVDNGCPFSVRKRRDHVVLSCEISDEGYDVSPVS